MVRPGARRGDDDLGAVTDKTGRVERRAVTASSRGVRGCHSTSDIPSTSAPIAPGMYYEPGAPGSSTQPPIPFTTHPPTTSYHPYTPVPYDPYGYSQPPQTSYDPYAHAPSLPIRMPTLDQTKHFSRTQIPLNDVSGLGLQLGTQFFEQLVGSVLVDSSYSGAEYGATAHGNSSSDVGPEKSRPPTNPIQRKKSKNDGLDIPVFSYVCTFGENGSEVMQTLHQRFAMLGHKTENKLIDLRIRLDKMTANEVRWTPYRTDEITDSPICPIGLSDSLGGFNAFQLILFVLRSTAAQQITGLSRSVQLPTIAPITPHVLLDMVARELDHDDIEDVTKVSRVSDMIKRYHQTRR
ncbi:hypothetical protein M9H77_34507 [Catharanthus roseus]|uniref:Uncharacterized protein n=1 Tax=Catharanthus roseus TaxID=4058 RepID=A0ACB9ZLD2_CATRO|nr:hypothetical protein M9H77_34507 [Catharanthus roseus]